MHKAALLKKAEQLFAWATDGCAYAVCGWLRSATGWSMVNLSLIFVKEDAE